MTAAVVLASSALAGVAVPALAREVHRRQALRTLLRRLLLHCRSHASNSSLHRRRDSDDVVERVQEPR